MGGCESSETETKFDTFDTSDEYPDAHKLCGEIDNLRRLETRINHVITQYSDETLEQPYPYQWAIDIYEQFREIERRVLTYYKADREYMRDTICDALFFKPYYRPHQDYMDTNSRVERLRKLAQQTRILAGKFGPQEPVALNFVLPPPAYSTS